MSICFCAIGQYIVGMVDVAAIKRRFHSLAPFLDERGRRLVLASEVAAAGRGSLKAVAAATGVARSTIGRGLDELRAGRDVLGDRVRRPGAGRKPATDKQPGLLDALCELIQSAIRGDPEAPLVYQQEPAPLVPSAHRARLQGRPKIGRPPAEDARLLASGQPQDARKAPPP